MGNKILRFYEQFNDNIELLRIIIKKKDAEITNKNFEGAAQFRDHELQLLYKMKQEISAVDELPISYLWVIGDNTPVKDQAIYIQDEHEFNYFINKFGLPRRIQFKHEKQDYESAYQCTNTLIEYCLKQRLPLPILIK